MMPCGDVDWVNIGSGNGFLPDAEMPTFNFQNA